MSPRAAAARFGFALGARIPFRVSHLVGGALGRVAYSLPGRTRHVTQVNLRLCFPDLSDAERARLGAASTAEAGRLAFELGGIWTWPRERIESLVREVRGAEHYEAALATGRGVALLTPHFGSWELLGLYHSLSRPTMYMYKPPRMRELDGSYFHGRGRFGAQPVPTTPSGVGRIVKALRRGGVVGLLPDQDPGRGAGVFAPFFGVQANTSPLVPRLLARTGAESLFCAAERLGDGSGFRVHYLPVAREMWSDDPVVATTAMNAAVEQAVRIAPEQYLWSYKRFRMRPEGEPDPYRSAPARGA